MSNLEGMEIREGDTAWKRLWLDMFPKNETETVGLGLREFEERAREVVEKLRAEDKDSCEYVPEMCEMYIDDDGNEHETDEPHEECSAFICDKCDYSMAFGDDWSWFDTLPPYKPYFKYCPNCGRKVIGAW